MLNLKGTRCWETGCRCVLDLKNNHAGYLFILALYDLKYITSFKSIFSEQTERVSGLLMEHLNSIFVLTSTLP